MNNRLFPVFINYWHTLYSIYLIKFFGFARHAVFANSCHLHNQRAGRPSSKGQVFRAFIDSPHQRIGNKTEQAAPGDKRNQAAFCFQQTSTDAGSRPAQPEREATVGFWLRS
jgi:hypothetical protein